MEIRKIINLMTPSPEYLLKLPMVNSSSAIIRLTKNTQFSMELDDTTDVSNMALLLLNVQYVQEESIE